jgi:hypothetical protein
MMYIFRFSFFLSYVTLNLFQCLFVFLLAFGFCLFPLTSQTQNLVYNPGFESDSAAVISSYSQLRAGQTLVAGWYVPTDGTSDYFN